ncbi:MAG: hypothetical protein HON55_03525, partial [Legionellales bacterium]|nr:hypothetical protein [Legionellales bacterium]
MSDQDKSNENINDKVAGSENSELNTYENKNRSVFALIAVVAVVGLLFFGYQWIMQQKEIHNVGSSAVAGGVSIESVPGLRETSSEYTGLQQKQNQQGAEVAAKTGGSSIPTIVRGAAAGNLSSFDAAQLATSDQDKARSCNLDSLKKARRAGVSAFELKCRGCSAAQLMAAGFTAADLREAGYSASELMKAGFSAAELRASGANACSLKKSGYTAAELKASGYSAAELKECFTAA